MHEIDFCYIIYFIINNIVYFIIIIIDFKLLEIIHFDCSRCGTGVMVIGGAAKVREAPICCVR